MSQSQTDDFRRALRYRAALRRAEVVAQSARFAEAATGYMAAHRAFRRLADRCEQADDERDRRGRVRARPTGVRRERAVTGRVRPPELPLERWIMTGATQAAEELARQLRQPPHGCW